MFYDETKVYFKAGKGGDGCVSFLRQKYMPKGGPNGGNGGKGGDVLMVADENVGDLRAFHFNPQWKAKNGEPGRGSDQHGKGGEDCLLKVPLGTVVQNRATGEVVHELLEADQEILLLEGGKGGRGNITFKTSVNQTPRQFTDGKSGEEGEFLLTLKTIADVGLVGFPNAGKSTFLSAVTRARPKIADYPFTTLHPNLGVGYVDGDEIILADIPGLIEGANNGAGLGDRFLGHIERCRVLLHIIDGTQDDPVSAYRTVRHELIEYGADINMKKELVALNKCDALNDQLIEEAQTALETELGKPVAKISGIDGRGLDEVLRQLKSETDTVRSEEAAQANMAELIS